MQRKTIFTVNSFTSFNSANLRFFVFKTFFAALLLNFFAAEIIIRANPRSPLTKRALAPLSIEVPLIFADSSLVFVGACLYG